MDCSMPGFFALYYLPEFSQTHFHWVDDAIQLSHPLSLLLLLPSVFLKIRAFPSESALIIRWPKYCSFSFTISSANEYSGLISIRIDLLDLLALQGTLKSLLQYHSSKPSILQCSAPTSGPTFTFVHGYRKIHSFDCMDFCQQSDVSAF